MSRARSALAYAAVFVGGAVVWHLVGMSTAPQGTISDVPQQPSVSRPAIPDSVAMEHTAPPQENGALEPALTPLERPRAAAAAPTPRTAETARSAEPAPPSPVAANAAPAERVPSGPKHPLTHEGLTAAFQVAGQAVAEECYSPWQQFQPGLGGNLLVRLTIHSDPSAGSATVTKAQITDATMSHAALEGCILSVMQELSFEHTGVAQDLQVTVPFAMASDDKPREPSPSAWSQGQPRTDPTWR